MFFNTTTKSIITGAIIGIYPSFFGFYLFDLEWWLIVGATYAIMYPLEYYIIKNKEKLEQEEKE